MLRHLLLFAISTGLFPAATAQGTPARGPSTASDAIAAFDAVRGLAEAQRTTAVQALGRFADDAVTDLLLGELATSTDRSYRAAVAGALGASARARAIEPLGALLTAPESEPGLRSAAARGLARQGDDGIALLRNTATADSANRTASSARTYALLGLSQAGTDTSWRALAEIASTATGTERSTALRHLERAPELPEVLEALLVGARDLNQVPIAATCARQLAERGHPEAAELVAAIVARAATTNPGTARGDLLRAMVAEFEPRFYEPVLVMGSVADATTNRVLDPLLSKLSSDATFIGWLRAALPKRKSSAERSFALRILGSAPGAEITLLIAEHTRAREPEIATTALRVLGRRGDPAAIPALRKLLSSKDPGRRPDTVVALHDLLHTEPEWRDELRTILQRSSGAREAAVRALALDLLADLQDRETLPVAWKDLGHRDWTVRAAALDFCRRVRDPESVPRLIERIDKESGRLREDVLDALQGLTAMRFMQRSHWDEWWQEASSGFRLVPADALATQRKPRPQHGGTTTYYGIPLVSDRVVFVVDISGSMSAQFGTDASRTRLDEAKRQLRRVLENTPKQFRFNIVPFHTTVDTVFERMMPAADQPRAEALSQVDALRPTGGTNVHDAMQRAFEETEVDTIYLLSDGAPSAGEITDPDALAEEIGRWNRSRRLRIHCISIGTDNPMMKRIAAESGGEYVSAR